VGYGDSSASPEEPGSANYSFRAMAQDQIEVLQALCYRSFFVAGHDRSDRADRARQPPPARRDRLTAKSRPGRREGGRAAKEGPG